jgi:hypothetical protein
MGRSGFRTSWQIFDKTVEQVIAEIAAIFAMSRMIPENAA